MQRVLQGVVERGSSSAHCEVSDRRIGNYLLLDGKNKSLDVY